MTITPVEHHPQMISSSIDPSIHVQNERQKYSSRRFERAIFLLLLLNSAVYDDTTSIRIDILRSKVLVFLQCHPRDLKARRKFAIMIQYLVLAKHVTLTEEGHVFLRESLLVMTQKPYDQHGDWKLKHGFKIVTVNVIKLHVYDLISLDSSTTRYKIAQFMIGCIVKACNAGFEWMGSGGFYHCGFEVNGIEYSYGKIHETEESQETGIYTCVPTKCEGYSYRMTIDFGKRRTHRYVGFARDSMNDYAYSHSSGRMTSHDEEETELLLDEEVEECMDGRFILYEMKKEYKAIDFDLYSKNCCTFVYDACLRFGIPEADLPMWIFASSNIWREMKSIKQFYPCLDV